MTDTHVESPVRGQPAAGFGGRGQEDLPSESRQGVLSPTQQIQALDRTQPVRPVAPGRVERRTHDYVWHGTTTLFAALEVATGQGTDACHPRHHHSEFLDFLRLVARAYPRRQLQVVLDDYATHKHVKVQAWLVRHLRVPLSFTPDLCVLAQSCRGLLRDHRAPSAATR